MSRQPEEIYVAQAQLLPATIAPNGRDADAVSSYRIEVRFKEGLTTTQRGAFKAAADRWVRIIVGDLPSVRVGQDLIAGLLIEAQGIDIDGPNHVLGQAGPTHLRPASAGASAFLPAKGRMWFDTADLATMEQEGTLHDVIAHEMGHVLGIGTIWDRKGLLQGSGTANPLFTGAAAQQAYGTLKQAAPQPVPVEDRGGPGTQDSHWRDTIFGNELMTGLVKSTGNPLSHLTIASLQDLGYGVSFDAADPYELPTLSRLMEMEVFASRKAPYASPDYAHEHAISTIPFVLPDDSLQ